MSDDFSIDASALDPVLLQLGLVSGLLSQSNGSIALNTDFFTDPIGQLKQIPSARADELVDLLTLLIGSATDSALGLAGAATNRQWIPLTYTDSSGNVQHTGCSIVVESVAASGNQPAATVFGFGASYECTVDGATLTPYAYLPLIAAAGGSVSCVLADAASAPSDIELGFVVHAANAFGAADFSFDGFRLATTFPLTGVRPQFEAVLINFTAPGEEPADRAFPLDPDPAAIETWISTALALIAGRLGGSEPSAANSVAALLAFLGGSGAVSPPDWAQIANGKMVTSWLLAIATTPGAAPAWLEALACMCSGKALPASGTPDVAGTGTALDPYTVPLGTLAGATVAFTLAVVAGSDGTMAFTPGLTIASPTTTPVAGQPIGARLSALLQLATLTLGASGSSATQLLPCFALEAVVANPAGTPLIACGSDLASLTIGSLRAGLTYKPSGLAPSFAMLDVSTTSGNWPSVDPTNYDADLNVLKDAIETIVGNELQKLANTEAGTVAQALAVLLGLIVPPAFATNPTTWPAYPGLLVNGGLGQFIANPLVAFGSYFARCLSAQVDNAPAFATLLPYAATLLGAEPGATVAGSGGGTDPWRVPVLAASGGSSCDLTAWYEPAATSGQQRIHLGLALDVPVALNAATASFAAQMDIFDFTLPTSSGSGVASCDWLPHIGANLTVTGPKPPALSLGPVAGITLGAQNLFAGMSWGRSQSLQWQAGVDSLVLTPTSGAQVALGNLRLGDMSADSLSGDLATLQRAVFAAAGLGLMRAGGPIGLALTCGLGLLPDLQAIFNAANPGAPIVLPAGFTLPSSWPSLQPGADPQKFLTDPWPALAAQLNALMTDANGEAAVRLFAWAITGTLPARGASGSGTVADPWTVPLGWHGAAVTLWGVDGKVGFGLRLPLAGESVASVTVSTLASLQLGTIAADGTLAAVPTLSLLCDVAPASGGYLVGDPAQHDFPAIASIAIGIDVSSDSMAPHVLLHQAQTSAAAQPTDASLVPGTPPQFIPSGVSVNDFALLIGAAMPALSNAAASGKLLTAGLDVLTTLHLAQSNTTTPPQFSIVPSAWSALLANPGGYIEAEMQSALADPGTGVGLLKQILALIGLDSVTMGLTDQSNASDLAAVPVLLSAIGLMRSTASGYVPVLSQLFALAKNPVEYLNTQLQGLGSSAARKQLLTALGPLLPAGGTASAGPLTLTATPQGVLTVSLGRQTTVGAGIAVGAAVDITADLVTPGLTLDLLLAAPAAGQGLALNWNPSNSGGRTITLVPTGAGPAGFAPLQLLPASTDYLAAVAENALESLLSTALGAVITAEVLPNAPIVVNVMNALGLIATGAHNQPSIVGLRPAFVDPMAWLLAPGRFGNGSGQFDLGRVGSVLNALPGAGITGPDGLSVKPSNSDGIALAGLPFGVAATLAADDTAGLTIAIDIAPAAVSGVTVGARGQAAFAQGAAPALSGSANATWTFSANNGSIGATADFGKVITVTASGELGGSGAVTLNLVPFGGLNQLISGAQSVLLKEIGGLLAAAWDTRKKTSAPTTSQDQVNTFIQAVIDAGAVLNITGDNYFDQVKTFVANPLGWLKTTFTGTPGATAIAKLVDLVANDFAIAGVTVANNQLQYLAPLPDHMPGNLTLKFGQSESSLALSAAVILQEGVMQIGFDAGAAMAIGDGTVTTNVSSSLGLDLADATGNRLAITPTIVLTAVPGSTPVTLSVYPLGTTATNVAEILPNPGLSPGDSKDWIMQVVTGLAVPVIADTVLATAEATNVLNSKIGASNNGPSSVTLGTILTAANLVVPSGQGYQLGNIAAAYGGKSPGAIAQQLLAAALSSFKDVTILSLDGVTLQGLSKQSGADTDYGLAVSLTGIALTSGGTGQLMLQVGDLYGEPLDQSWLALASNGAALAPGVGLYMLRASDGGTSYSFHFGFELGSVGVDYVAATGQTLFNIDGVTTTSLELRLALSVDQDQLSDPAVIGAAVRADGIGIPLGPSFQASTSSSNPVAQSLLASGGSGSATGSGAVNPTFGATFGYIDKVYFAFRKDGSSDPGDTDRMLWLPVQRAFGPLQCQQIGVGSENGAEPTFDAGFDGSVSLSGLAIGLNGLEIKIPLKTPLDITSYGLSLDGLSVSFSGGPISITGALIEVPNPLSYTGELQVTSPALSVTALGSYGTIAGSPSLFAYAIVPAVLGGPPCFFVTGLAGGFGYNRDFIVPPVDQIAAFPFVSWAGGAAAPSSGEGVLEALGNAVPPVQGENWLAAGVTFTSFELLNTTALLVIQFGTSFQLDLVGTSKLTLPKGSSSPYVYAEIELEVVFDPADGLLKALAQLTPNSYVIDSDCHLTGGFAFYSWFSGDHAGDFVVTFGGYIASYTPQTWYPQQGDVPRLGISWSPGGGVQVSGTSYFALTPSCVMAGEAMQATYSSGPLSAWFSAYADFLINWHPFYYEGDAGVSVGASITLHVLVSMTLSVELSATLHAWGPPFAGEIEVDWTIMSFTISIGDTDSGNNAPDQLSWGDFSQYFLPAGNSSSNALAAAAPADSAPVSWIKVTALAGKLAPQSHTDPGSTWIIDPAKFVVKIDSVVPMTTIASTGVLGEQSFSGAGIGVFPMNQQELTATLTLELAAEGDSDNAPWTFTPVVQGAPSALWGTSGKWSPTPSSTALTDYTLSGCLLGVTGRIDAPPTPSGLAPMPIDVLLTDKDTLPARTFNGMAPSANPAAPDATLADGVRSTIASTVMAATPAGTRNQIVAAAAEFAGLAVANGPLDVLAAEATLLLQQDPMLATNGVAVAAGQGAIRAAWRSVGISPPRRIARATRVADQPERPVVIALHRTATRAGGRREVQTIRQGLLHPLHRAALSGAAHGGAGKAMQLGAGAGLVWRVPNNYRGALTGDGALPLRIVAVGANGWPILDASGDGTVELPDNSRFVAVFAAALPATEAAPWSGWHPGLAMPQVTSDCLVGHDATVRTQAPLLRRGRRLLHDLGAWKGHEIAARNRVQVGGRPQTGWIVTALPAGTRDLALMFAKPAGGDAFDARAAAAALNLTVLLPRERGGASVPVEATGSFDTAHGGVLLFRIDAPADAPLKVRTELTGGAPLVGVIGSGQPLDAARLEAVLAPPAATHRSGRSARVSWIEKAAR